MNMPPIVSPQEWEAAREELLVKEKELTRARDALAAERRRMPRMAVEKDYRFDGPDGPASLLELFAGRRQLIVYRYFFEPGVAGWPESGCRGCSFVADQVAHLAHLNARDTTLAFVSRAPQPDIARWKARMGWEIPWYTITDDFDVDFGVDEWHGTNAFVRDGDGIFRTLLRQQQRRRGDGEHLELPRPHCPRASGGMGGLARGLPADTALPVVEPPRRIWRGNHVRGARSQHSHNGSHYTRACRGCSGGTSVAQLRRRGSPDMTDTRRCASSAPFRRPPRRCSTPGPGRRCSCAGGTPGTTGRPARPRSTFAWAGSYAS